MKQSLIILVLLISYNCFSQNWVTDFSEAKKLSAAKNENIVLVFSGSDWCGPCIKMERDIWSTQEFINFADEHVVMFKADFPRKKKNKLSKEQQDQNNILAEKYHAKFPLVVVLNSDGKVLDSFGYIKKFSPQDYIDRISNL